jgi:two-component system cell cycle response regulator DivK
MQVVLEFAFKVNMSENNTTILYVEDNQDNRLLIRRILMAEGSMLLKLSTPGRRWISSRIYIRTLVDINMPDMDGYALTAMLRQKATFE